MSKVYEIVTERILALLESGTVPWQRPWAGGGLPMNYRGTEYRGVNPFILASQGYARALCRFPIARECAPLLFQPHLLTSHNSWSKYSHVTRVVRVHKNESAKCITTRPTLNHCTDRGGTVVLQHYPTDLLQSPARLASLSVHSL